MPLKKSVLEPNVLLKGNQELIVEGIGSGTIMVLNRDVIEVELGVVELADQTRVPGGRRRAGDFTVTLQLARDDDRKPFLSWYNKCLDKGQSGIDGDYKKNGFIKYYRLYSGATTRGLVEAKLIGIWPSKINMDESDMEGGDEGDADAKLEITINFDDAYFT